MNLPFYGKTWELSQDVSDNLKEHGLGGRFPKILPLINQLITQRMGPNNLRSFIFAKPNQEMVYERK
jgi:hypothetical protein